MSIKTWLDTVDGTPNVCIFWGGSSTKARPSTAVVRTDLPPPEFTRSQWDDVNNQWVDVTPVPPAMVGSREIRESLTGAERRTIRRSSNDDVGDAYEEVITMGSYELPVDDPKLSDFLTLVRSAHPEHTYNDLAELIGAEVL